MKWLILWLSIYNFYLKIEFTKVLLLSETYLRPIGDRHAWSETLCRPRQIYGIPTSHIGDCNARSETPRRPTCAIGDRHPHRRLTSLWRFIGDQHASGVQSDFWHIYLLYIYIYIIFILILVYWMQSILIFIYFCLFIYIGIMQGLSLIRCVGIWWVSD